MSHFFTPLIFLTKPLKMLKIKIQKGIPLWPKQMEQVIRSVYELDKKKLAKELIESFSIIKDEEMLLEIFQRMVLFIDNVHRNDRKESIIDVLKGEDIMPIVMEQWIEELKERGRKEGGPKAARKVAKKAEMMKNLETCAVGRTKKPCG